MIEHSTGSFDCPHGTADFSQSLESAPFAARSSAPLRMTREFGDYFRRLLRIIQPYRKTRPLSERDRTATADAAGIAAPASISLVAL